MDDFLYFREGEKSFVVEHERRINLMPYFHNLGSEASPEEEQAYFSDHRQYDKWILMSLRNKEKCFNTEFSSTPAVFDDGVHYGF